MFWYISKNKLEAMPKLLSRSALLPHSVTLEGKFPFVSGEVRWTEGDQKATELVETLAKQLNQQFAVKPFDMVPEGDHPLLVLFKGPAAKLIDNKAIWIATHNQYTKPEGTDISQALLLTGSASNVVGSLLKDEEGISPSADAVSAVIKAFATPEIEMTTRKALSFAWHSVWRRSQDATTLPCIWGLAFFAARFPSIVSEFNMLGLQHITHLTIASPLFVQQIESTQSIPITPTA